MSTKITTTREFRRGRTLMNKDTDFLLVHSPAPREWVGVLLQDGAAPVIQRRSSTLLERSYDQMSTGGGTRWPVTNPDRDSILGALETAWRVTPVEWRVRSGLQRRAAYTPTGWSPSPPSPATATLKGKLAASVAALEESRKAELAAASGSAKKAGSRASVFEVPKADAKPYWYESPQDRKLIRDFIALNDAEFTVNLMIAGPSGAGKTRGVEKLGEELGIPVHIVNCQAITTPEKWLGQMMADPEKGTYFEPSQHIQWVERTHPDCQGHDQCILLYDEITRLRPELNNMTYSLFDTQRGLEVPQMGRRVMMAKGNIIISTANIGAAFAGTFGQDRAFRERFSMTMERDFPPHTEEVKILTSATGIAEVNANDLCRIAQRSRSMWKEGAIEQPISTRTLVTWALLVAGGYTVMQAAEYTVLPMYSEDGGVESDRAKIKLQIEGKVA